MDLGYPNISYSGFVKEQQDALIGVNHSGPNDAPGFSSIFYDGKGNYSSVTKLIEGKSYINSFQNGSERWGDYFGMQRSYKDGNAAWLAGYYGQKNNNSAVYVAKVGAPTNAAGVANHQEKIFKSITFPNPTSTRFTVEFELDESMNIEFTLLNLNGQVVDKLLEQKAKKGKNEFSFSALLLSQGVYILNLSSNGKTLSTHKVIVE